MCSVLRPFSLPGAFLSIFLNGISINTNFSQFRISIPGTQNSKDTDPSRYQTNLLQGPTASFGNFTDSSLNRFIVQQLDGTRAESKSLQILSANGSLLGEASIPLRYPLLSKCNDRNSSFFYTGSVTVESGSTAVGNVGYSLQYAEWYLPSFYCEKTCFERALAQPANSISSLAFLFVAFPMLRAAFCRKPRGFHAANAAANALAGFGSFLFHGTFAPPAQQADMAGVYAIMIVPLLHVCWVVTRKQKPQQICFFIFSLCACAVFGYYQWELETFIAGKETTLVCIIGSLLFISVLMHARKTQWSANQWADGVIALLALAIAIAGRFGDSIACAPAHWFQFHAVWHVFAALSFYFLWKTVEPERSERIAKTNLSDITRESC